ncbi:baculoviral IAP repeat-containing protein 1 [Dipodomys merriami]|uniref:baculoviral IAP repeat-containing protein 1 n=1 Tax=Dipodomys merriami TaxID=94247 RepID=UPI003855F2EF
MASAEEAPEEKTSQYEYGLLSALSGFLGTDLVQLRKEVDEEQHRARKEVKKGFNAHMRNEEKRLKTFMTYNLDRCWTPQEMAAAGFYFTGIKSEIQCFCCSLILFDTNFWKLPLGEHKKFHPDCEFLLGKDVGNISKYDVRVKSPAWELKGDKAKYQEEEARLESFQTWPFYVQGIPPQELSAAGFAFTGKRDTVQCFSCGGCLGNWEEGDDPWKEHAKWFPKCEFLQSKKSSKEIAQYIQSYKGFVDVTGEHFVNSWIQRELPMASAYNSDSVFANEELRLDTFKNWPHKFSSKVSLLAKAGLIFTEIKDIVHCFSCGLCMEKWKEDDDPLKDHIKYSPSCLFLQNMKSSAEEMPDPQSQREHSEVLETTKASKEVSAAVHSRVPEEAPRETQWLQKAKRLSEQLRAAYIKASFRHMSLLGMSPNQPTDRLLGCDLSIVSKHISSPAQEALMMPEVLANLNSIMCVEGEVGSGKTVFLKKIAFLWASGCCPLLNRFQLVFFLSLRPTGQDRGLASIIHDQLLDKEDALTEECLRNIIQQFKNQVLFLLDDYSEMYSIPQAIQKMILRNHTSRTCLLIATHRNRTRDIRQYLHTVLDIQDFPFYNTVYILRTLCPYNFIRLLKFYVYFEKNQDVQGILKTPLFVAAIWANWSQYPLHLFFDDVAVFKSYMEHLSSRDQTNNESLKAAVSSCGQLALKGLFASRFEFDVDDLMEAGLDEDGSLTTCFMSKFTAQRLRPVYRFLNPAFQEFLAGMKLIELLDSDRQEEQELGVYYLKEINSSLKAVFLYKKFLIYVSSQPSTKVGPKLVSHLLQLVDHNESLESVSEKDEYLQIQLESSPCMQLMWDMWKIYPKTFFAYASLRLLDLALKVACQSSTMATCSPFFLQFFQGRTLGLEELASEYFFDYPESLLVLKSIKVTLNGKEPPPWLCLPDLERCYDKSQIPAVDADYAAAFEPMKEWEQNIAEKKETIHKHLSRRLTKAPRLCGGYWNLSPPPHKIPLLEVHVSNMDAADQEMLRVLMTAFSVSQRIELHLTNSTSFLESIRPALEQHRTSVTRCSIDRSELSAAEQELLLSLPFLESLDISETVQLQDQILANLDKFPCLKELSVKLDNQRDVFSVIPEEFSKLHHMEKLWIQIFSEKDSSKLVKLIQNSPDLRVFYLKCYVLDFESLMNALVSCKKLEEIQFSGRCFEVTPFVTSLPNFTSLKILNLNLQYFPDKETSEKFASALGFLTKLEELNLPTGDGIQQVAKLIVQQCQQLLPCLRVLSFFQTLSDDSIMEIAQAAISGGFQKLEKLNLSLNHKVTEEGYRAFFQALDNLPALQELDISRYFTHCIKVQATTVKALSQCVLRLPSLTTLSMQSWLLDTEDIILLNVMRERHPQSKHFTIFWKCILPIEKQLTQNKQE